LKPANVMITDANLVKVLDFGLARDTSAHAPSDHDATTLGLTQAGIIVGTVPYMSPEQIEGRTVDHRSDIFSLGIVLYEMVTGQLPFSGSNPLDTLHAIAFEETRPITAVRPNLPPSLQRVVTRCLRKRAADRYADAKELASDLKAVQREVESGISSKAPLALRLQERWRTLQDRTLGEWLLPAGIVVVVLAIALSFFFARSGSASDDGPLPGLVFLVIVGLLAWRRIRNRRLRLARRFTTKVKKMAEVRLVALDGMRFTIVADNAQARTYVRANAALDAVNGSMFFGDPFSLVVREDVGPEDERALLSASGILYVREPPRVPAAG
jgi:protein kinase-like protein